MTKSGKERVFPSIGIFKIIHVLIVHYAYKILTTPVHCAAQSDINTRIIEIQYDWDYKFFFIFVRYEKYSGGKKNLKNCIQFE